MLFVDRMRFLRVAEQCSVVCDLHCTSDSPALNAAAAHTGVPLCPTPCFHFWVYTKGVRRLHHTVSYFQTPLPLVSLLCTALCSLGTKPSLNPILPWTKSKRRACAQRLD